MNSFAYRTTGLAIKTIANLSKARVTLHGTDNIPEGAKIFVPNHFTRLETFLIPYYLHNLIKLPVWSIAAAELFVGSFGRYLESVGAVSTKNPDRDRLIVKSLLTGEAAWVIFPEGRMVKSKKIVEKGRFMISYAGGKHAPHTGAAYLALRTEFYRQRLLQLVNSAPQESDRLLEMFNLSDTADISRLGTYIVPVNLTYYPLRAKLNALNAIAARLVEGLPDRITEELMTEGAMLVSGVDIDIRFGKPIDIGPYLHKRQILRDLRSPRSFGFDDPLPCLKCLRQNALKIMQRYMGAIYALTTVNHDHIFASLLKHYPKNKINEANFRRLAFLSIQEAAKLPFHLHQSLQADQNHLLMDDRFGKVANFFNLAQETGVVDRHPSHLFRHQRKISKIFDYQRARVDNPVAVIANEVEPLVRLHQKISRLCWLPGFMARRRLARFLLQKAQETFVHDYEAYQITGESKPRHIGAPVLLRGRSRKVGIVLCHGYMAAPAEVLLLGKFLAAKGYWVYMPRLAGHGTSPEDLAQRSFQDWIVSMEEGYLMMRNQCRRVVLGGFSTGAALALELASRCPDVAGLFAVSTPLRLQYLGSRLAPVLDTWNKIMGRVNLKEARKEFIENQPENPHINYFRNPISGVHELEQLMDYLEPKLSKIHMPALVVQSQKDPVVHPKGSERIFSMLGSEDKQYLVFNHARHGILLGPGSEKVHHAIGVFIDQLRRKTPLSPAPETAR